MPKRNPRECDGLCYYCHEWTITATENMDMWPLWFAHGDDEEFQPHHIKCVRTRLHSFTKFQTDLTPFLNQLTHWPRNGVLIKELQQFAGRLLNLLKGA